MKEVRFHRFSNFDWEGIKKMIYKNLSFASWRGVSRRVFLKDNTAKFEVRYFEVEPGGFTTYETHRHIHLVICIRGKGKAIAGEREFEMTPFDVLYIGPDVPHQFLNTGDEPFGFICVVDRERDRPRVVRE